MHFDKITRPSVGADLSRTPPIYRPSVDVPISRLFCENPLSALSGFPTIPMNKLNCIIAPLHSLCDIQGRESLATPSIRLFGTRCRPGCSRLVLTPIALCCQ
jgi:hypothetical protein